MRHLRNGPHRNGIDSSTTTLVLISSPLRGIKCRMNLTRCTLGISYVYTAPDMVALRACVNFRSNDLVRIRVRSDCAVDFPLITDSESTNFAADIGVTAVEVLEEEESDFYVDFLGAQIGDVLEFFNSDGTEATPSGRIAEFSKNRARIKLSRRPLHRVP